jgi:hypothetical protein
MRNKERTNILTIALSEPQHTYNTHMYTAVHKSSLCSYCTHCSGQLSAWQNHWGWEKVYHGRKWPLPFKANLSGFRFRLIGIVSPVCFLCLIDSSVLKLPCIWFTFCTKCKARSNQELFSITSSFAAILSPCLVCWVYGLFYELIEGRNLCF